MKKKWLWVSILMVASIIASCSKINEGDKNPVGPAPPLYPASLAKSPADWPKSMNDFKWPVVYNQKIKIFAGYGPLGGSSYHRGAEWHAVDLINGDSPKDTRWMWIVNPARGKVKQLGTNPNDSRGYFVIMDHGNGWESRIYHLQTDPSSFIAVDNDLLQGTFLGYTGSTGYATGAHIHFVILKDGISQALTGIDDDYSICISCIYTSSNVYVRPPFGIP